MKAEILSVQPVANMEPSEGAGASALEVQEESASPAFGDGPPPNFYDNEPEGTFGFGEGEEEPEVEEPEPVLKREELNAAIEQLSPETREKLQKLFRADFRGVQEIDLDKLV